MVKTYTCPKCLEFEHECNIKDNELTLCPKCQSTVTRVFKAIHYSWKTGGFAGKGHA